MSNPARIHVMSARKDHTSNHLYLSIKWIEHEWKNRGKIMSGVLIYNANASIRKSGAAMKPTEATAAERDVYSTVMIGAVCGGAVLALDKPRAQSSR